MNYKKMLKKAGFCFWELESWAPCNGWIDWANNYDEAMIKLLVMFNEKLEKRDRKIAKLQHELAKLRSGAIEVHHHIDFDEVYAEVDKELPA